MRSVAIAAISVVVLAAAAHAQRPQLDPGKFLRAISVRIHLRSAATNDDGLCHGFIGAIDTGAGTAYVVTAKHCVQALVEGRRLLPGTGVANLEDLKISAEVRFPDGSMGSGRQIIWSTADDVLVVYADHAAVTGARSYQELCRPACAYYTLQFFLPANIPIYSVLSAQGNSPIVSTGRLLVDIFSRITVDLPAAPWTSGSPVIDGKGALVGMLNTGDANAVNGSAPVVKLVSGRTVQKLLESAVAHPRPLRPTASTPAPAPVAPAAAPVTPAPPVPASVPSLPTPAPPVPAPAPSTAPAVASDPFLILPGLSVDSVSLGSQIREAIDRLGASKGTLGIDDGTLIYRWFEPPGNSGVGVRTAQNGTVLRVWVLNDERYHTREGLHAGSTEAEVRAALGNPSRVDLSAQGKTKTLMYESIGLWFGIQLDPQYSFYNTVFDIGVQQPK